MSTPQTIDASGLSCPQPVLLFLQAVKAAPDGEFVVIVDNEASRENVSRAARTRVKNAIKAVRAAVTAGDKAQANTALSAAASVLAKAAGKGSIHWKKAARKVSRLARAVNAVEA